MDKKQEDKNKHMIKKHELFIGVAVFVIGILIGSFVIAGPAALRQCNDGIDNDGDTRRDYPNDPGCSNKRDNNERGTIPCDDGIDNDGDTRTDYPNDNGCSGNFPADDDEQYCGDGACEIGKNSIYCPADCPPTTNNTTG